MLCVIFVDVGFFSSPFISPFLFISEGKERSTIYAHATAIGNNDDDDDDDNVNVFLRQQRL